MQKIWLYFYKMSKQIQQQSSWIKSCQYYYNSRELLRIQNLFEYLQLYMIKQTNTHSLKALRQQNKSNAYKSFNSSISQQTPTLLQTLAKFTPLDTCQYHDQQIQFCCFDCKEMCCCSKCLINGKHQTHDVKNIHRGYCMVEALLNQFTVKLAAKVQIYSLWHEKISIGKSELIEDFLELKRMVNARFCQLREMLEKKNTEVIDLIEQLKAKKEDHLSESLAKLRSKIKLNHESQLIVQNNIQELSEPSLCKYYSEMKDHLYTLVTQDIQAELKILIARPKYTIDQDKLESAKSSIEKLSSIYSIDSAVTKKTKYRAHFNIPSPLLEDQQLISQSVFINKRNYRDSYHSPSAATPKNVSEFTKDFDSLSKAKPSFGNIITKNDSRKTLKLFSATSSPFKDKKQSPLHYLQLQKKCFIKGKQNE